MMVHLFFLTITIKKREFNADDMKKEQRREYSQKLKNDMKAKHAEYQRFI
ncbi:YrzI family small protein [Bacillus shivajii]|nr:YrzI family small protein [Bacillus shivajii]UCZ52076.1 YrzI family small protein [Bacillus shivajii]